MRLSVVDSLIFGGIMAEEKYLLQMQDSGSIIYDGELRERYNTIQALGMGISMIHQELSPVLHRPMMENIWLGREPLNRFGLVDHQKMYDMSVEVLKEIELNEDPRTEMVQLTVAKMQMIEIAKAVSYDSNLIIMDEPTSALTEKEIKQLFMKSPTASPSIGMEPISVQRIRKIWPWIS
jgi:ABC-type sugar transport system ATPase subunit